MIGQVWALRRTRHTLLDAGQPHKSSCNHHAWLCMSSLLSRCRACHCLLHVRLVSRACRNSGAVDRQLISGTHTFILSTLHAPCCRPALHPTALHGGEGSTCSLSGVQQDTVQSLMASHEAGGKVCTCQSPCHKHEDQAPRILQAGQQLMCKCWAGKPDREAGQQSGAHPAVSPRPGSPQIACRGELSYRVLNSGLFLSPKRSLLGQCSCRGILA